MPAIAMTRASVLKPVIAATQAVNAPVEGLLRKRGLPTSGIDAPDAWVPTKAVLMLAEDVHGIVGPEAFGPWLEQAGDLSALGPFTDTLRRSKTLFDAVQHYHRFYRQFRNYAQLSMTWVGGHLWIRRFVDPGTPGNTEILQLYAIDEMTNIVRLAAGDGWQPKKVVVQPDATTMLETMPHLAGASAFMDSDYCAIAVPAKLLSQPVRQMPTSAVSPTPDKRPAWAPPPESFADCTLAIVSNRFSDGYPGVDAVAESIGVSRRTLQRGLAAEGLTYRDVIDLYRFETAKRFILEDGVKLSDVAAALEYNDAGSFTRAFRRWAGVSPRVYRALHTEH